MRSSKAPMLGVGTILADGGDSSANELDKSPEWVDRRATERARRASEARQASGRRRNVDPTTCEKSYSDEELEFMRAMEDYKHSSGRMFPTWSEVLEVLRALGYEKLLGEGGVPFGRLASGEAAGKPPRRAASA